MPKSNLYYRMSLGIAGLLMTTGTVLVFFDQTLMVGAVCLVFSLLWIMAALATMPEDMFYK